MRLRQGEKSITRIFLIILFQCISSIVVWCQIDTIPPQPPQLLLVSINPISGKTDITWSLSKSPDVAGYTIYYYHFDPGFPGGGYSADSIYAVSDPTTTTCSVFRPYSLSRIESFVVAAFDNAGNYSPLSNELNTILAESKIDSCKKISISWNKYNSDSVKVTGYNVTGYDVFASVNSSQYYLAGHVSNNVTAFSLNDFINSAQYCFLVKAVLENSQVSVSNRSCDTFRIQIPPGWINADYATVTAEGDISLSFSIDPASEIDLFAIERRSGFSGSFQQIAQVRTDIKSVTYTDKTAEKDVVYFYKLSAINSCNNKVVSSNIASNIVLNIQNTGSEIILRWNKYHDWLGSVASYRIYIDTGNGFTEKDVTTPSDTIYNIYIPDVMYTLTQGKVCFYISATESGNPYGITGESNSNQICSDIEEVITVPNIFSPDGDGINDLFKPVITFAPSSYQLLITDRQRKTIFETRDYNESWDGSASGSSVSQGVYLWFLKLTTPSGKNITRTGTVTVIKTR